MPDCLSTPSRRLIPQHHISRGRIMDASSTSLLSSKRRELLALDTQKKSLESEAEAIVAELTAELPDGGPPIGISTPLVDDEGFPRADIDIYRARTLRKRFKEIQNDHKDLLRRIDRGLVEVAALMKSNNDEADSATNDEQQLRSAPKPAPKFDPVTGKWVVKSWDGAVAGVQDGERRRFDDLMGTNDASDYVTGTATGGGINAASDAVTSSPAATTPSNATTESFMRQQQPTEPVVAHLEPFAIIDQVFSNSPASSAGIQEGDVLLQFGPIHSNNHENFSAIAKLVPQIAGDKKNVPIKVRRKREMELGEISDVIDLELWPRVWEGRGLLGCHISKYVDNGRGS
eukprot:CCRYP_014649-RA/>CCRYP_014649-RA protein AED:0.10 eAED:0.10 QI:3173/1/1/1/1/1/3/2753/344